ncbi:lysostaphin resistance A-like protein [Algibacter sp. PT7-4]|uniref:CPBP family intramembrane glutamic endopeptidase n=1 Tax=Algibacter ulvanivorans TaxID=3400999 RepID=UPI003AAF5C1B
MNVFNILFKTHIKQNNKEKKAYRWHVAITILILFIIGAVLNIPFSREVKRLSVEAGVNNVHLNNSIFTDIVNTGVSSLVLGVFLVIVGLWISSKTNLGAPIIARIFSQKKVRTLIGLNPFLSSIILAIVVAVILLGLFELQKAFYPVTGKMARPSKPFYVFVSFSAGITEEIMFRLGLMSLIIAVIQFVKKAATPSNAMVWVGIMVSAICFGLIHIPFSKNFVNLTLFSITVTMVGNLITGITFGWVFWKRGLLVAIACHVIFDLVFHVIGSPFN